MVKGLNKKCHLMVGRRIREKDGFSSRLKVRLHFTSGRFWTTERDNLELWIFVRNLNYLKYLTVSEDNRGIISLSAFLHVYSYLRCLFVYLSIFKSVSSVYKVFISPQFTFN